MFYMDRSLYYVLLWHRILTEGRCRQYDEPAQWWSCGRSSGNCCSLGKASEETMPCGRWSQGSSRQSCARHWSKLWSRWRWLIFDFQTADNDSSSNSVRCILTTQSLHESSHNFRLPVIAHQFLKTKTLSWECSAVITCIANSILAFVIPCVTAFVCYLLKLKWKQKENVT